jgi:uncharacterized protein YcbK (DUF882 family)
MTDQIETPSMSRRSLLIASAQLTLGLSLFSPAELLAKKSPPESIAFYHTHTGERFELGYIGKKPPLKVKRSLYSFLRDFRTGEVHPIDFRLMDILYKIKRETSSKGVFEVISGYRSPRTNEKLRSKSNGVAQKSLHLQGQAIDIRLTDASTKDVRDAALSLRAGGVGYYAKSDFVHIDTGKVRSW